MAAFATVAAADLRAREKTADNTWLEAHGNVSMDAVPQLWVLRTTGVWAIITDDAAV